MNDIREWGEVAEYATFMEDGLRRWLTKEMENLRAAAVSVVQLDGWGITGWTCHFLCANSDL
jgi:hypothetical protein